MLVNLGLTADAAAIHRHEFSTHQRERSNTPTLSQVSNSILSLGFMSSGRRTLASVPGNRALPQTIDGQGNLASPLSSPLSSQRSSVEAERDQEYPQFGSGSEVNQEAPLPPRKRQARRSKTSFRFAHPPPSTHRRLRIRPRLLLQLQHISQSSRPIAALDVIPSSFFGTRSTRKVSNPCRGRDRIGPNDLVIIPSDSYGPLNDKERSSFDIERDLIAIISHPLKEDYKSKGLVEICMGQGGLWEITAHSNSVYEFTCTDKNGLRRCARWVLRGKESRNSTGSVPARDSDSKRFTFSVIDPTTRRHPVIAWMTGNGIDVLDQYPTTFVSMRSPSTSISSPSSSAPVQEHKPLSDHNNIEIDSQLRTLIVVTGIWVALREGWSRYPLSSQTEETVSRSQSTKTPPTKLQPQMLKTDGNNSEIGAPPQNSHRHSFHSVGDRVRRHSSHMYHQPFFSRPGSGNPESNPETSGMSSENAIPRQSSKSRRHERHSILCIRREASSSPDIPHRGMPRRPSAPRHSNTARPEQDDDNARRPASRNALSASPRRHGLTKGHRWCGLGLWIDSMSKKVKKKTR
ncbi:hypothetical protein PRK78_006264 [Emydomyces testavorans]|uniref:Uncharacterized protein n=1 Tax=Emydomyces testavorans TaxID=2070801 RepID=A0AAF0ILH8_9EURO|nr:hypothetical protein PRK78_006264 [Emydomyces testavorans]